MIGPQIIALSNGTIRTMTNKQHSLGYLQAMADSDGSIGKYGSAVTIVQFGQTQKTVIDLISSHLAYLNIEHKTYGPWNSNGSKYAPMYRIRIQKKTAVRRFMKLIGFRHPARLAKANTLRKYWDKGTIARPTPA